MSRAALFGAFAALAFGVAFAVKGGAAAVLVALPCLFMLGHIRSPRRAFYAGLVAGVLLYAPHLAFFYKVFGPAGALLWLITGLPIGVFVLLLSGAHRRLGPAWAVLLTPILWTGIEYFRSELYHLRFAWLLPGEAVALQPGVWMLRAGVYGLGFAYALAAAMVIGPGMRVRVVGIIASVALAALPYLPVRRPAAGGSSSPLHVAGVQMEFPSDAEVVRRLDRLATDHPEAQILVLSEYTFHGPVPAAVRDVVKRHGRYLVVGGERRRDAGGGFYDTAFVIGPDGRDVFQQGKSVPVQFMDDGLPAAERRVWDSPWGKIGIAICYDVSYARVMDDFVRQGARGLILPTMDLENWGLYERRMLHGRMAPTRSAEYGIPVFSVWSSGESQLTDRGGRLIATAGYPGQGDEIAGPFDLSRAGRGPPDRALAMACTLGTAGFIVFLIIPRRRRGTSAPDAATGR
jgi:apolipoprotein N-acyltransferase